LLVSRGIAEAEWGGTEFGLDRVKEYFLHNKAQNARDLCSMLLSELQQSACARRIDNDLTALALVRPSQVSRIATS
jgi:serine phosphatase RsbU (regulator of sigma subunit)